MNTKVHSRGYVICVCDDPNCTAEKINYPMVRTLRRVLRDYWVRLGRPIDPHAIERNEYERITKVVGHAYRMSGNRCHAHARYAVEVHNARSLAAFEKKLEEAIAIKVAEMELDGYTVVRASSIEEALDQMSHRIMRGNLQDKPTIQ